ncbi:MAG: DUF4935 domain-containing protein [Gemmatimonadetes bacterium]|nr:DUF4935 domain-containing protein [Gemmatimonadota bacterium]
MTLAVIIDTNIWVANPLLNSPLGSAFLFEVERLGGRVVLPEVVEREVHKHTLRLVAEARESIARAYGIVSVIMGGRDDYQVPTDEEVQARVRTRLGELNHLIERVPLTLDHSSRALTRVLEDRLPNSPKNQQFKDSLLWECAIDQGVTTDLHLVSSDTAFFENRKYDQGMASELRAECAAAGATIHLHQSVDAMLQMTRDGQPPFDATAVVEAIQSVVLEEANSIAARKGVRLSHVVGRDVEAYVTQQYGQLAVKYHFVCTANLNSPEGPTGVSSDLVNLSGSATFKVADQSATDVMLNDFEFLRNGVEPAPDRSERRVFASASIFLGRGTVPHQYRAPVPVQLPVTGRPAAAGEQPDDPVGA